MISPQTIVSPCKSEEEYFTRAKYFIINKLYLSESYDHHDCHVYQRPEVQSLNHPHHVVSVLEHVDQ